MHDFQNTSTSSCLGFLVDELSRKHEVYPASNPLIFGSQDLAPLRQHLSAQSHIKLSRRDKLHLAVIIASSVLQLYETPWLQATWSSDDIFFGQPEKKLMHERVFVSKFTTDDRQAQQSGARLHATLPLVPNDSIFALGILLIELCLSASLAELRKPEDVTAAGGTVNAVSDFITATRLIDDVYQEGGSRYGSAVRRCIRCEFDQRRSNLDDDGFRQAVYMGVVKVLEEDLESFDRLP